MDINVTEQLIVNGFSTQPPVAAGTRKSTDVDMLVAYSDVWRWELVMYLKTLNINIFDAKTGNLIVTGRWDNSAFYGVQNATGVVKELTDEMLAKVKAASTTNQ